MSKGTVFITQESPGRNFLPAREFGELKILLPGDAQVVLDSTNVVRRLQEELENFGDDDHLLLSGDPVIIGIAVGVALSVNDDLANLLKWDRQTQSYYSVHVDLYPDQKEGEYSHE
jgi:hypothetical protein